MLLVNLHVLHTHCSLCVGGCNVSFVASIRRCHVTAQTQAAVLQALYELRQNSRVLGEPPFRCDNQEVTRPL